MRALLSPCVHAKQVFTVHLRARDSVRHPELTQTQLSHPVVRGARGIVLLGNVQMHANVIGFSLRVQTIDWRKCAKFFKNRSNAKTTLVNSLRRKGRKRDSAKVSDLFL